jgi:ribosome-binding factor A
MRPFRDRFIPEATGLKARRCSGRQIGLNGAMSNRRHPASSGPTQRQLRVGELIRRTLADVLHRADVHDPELNRMSITVGEVICSSDLKVATVHVMPLMGGATVEDAIAALARNKAELRRIIAREMTLKYAPDLRFRPDGVFAQLDETRRLFSDPTVRRDLETPEPDDTDDTGSDGTKG